MGVERRQRIAARLQFQVTITHAAAHHPRCTGDVEIRGI
jgi:hypothetical protein